MKELLYLTFIFAFLAVGVLSQNGTTVTTATTTEATTTATTTEATTTATTTAATTTATTTAATTTIVPKTTPQPGLKPFVIKNCLALKANIKILGKSLSESVPTTANVTGGCGESTSNLTLSWQESNSITFEFANRTGMVYLQEVSVKLANNSDKATINMKLSDDKTYYACPTTLLQVGAYNVTLDGLKVQAFNYNTTFSGSGEYCDATSSVAPSTTQIPASSTVPPTPSPKIPPVDNYTVSGVLNGTNVTCLVMQAAIKLKIPYEGKSKNHTYDGSIGSSPSYTGTCTNSTDTLKITSGAVTLDLTFTNTGTDYYLYELKLTADAKKFKDGKDVQIVSNYTNTKKQNPLKLGDSYSCRSKTTLHLSSDVELDITNLKLAAFRKSNTSKIDSGKMVLCPQDQQTNSIVPIAVGAALAGLVVVVLIAYLIGRKRSRRGYESV